MGSDRTPHPVLSELLGGLEVPRDLDTLDPDSEAVMKLRQMFVNAEYWLSVDAQSLEPLLQRCPSPLRELGVGIALRFGERFGGALGLREIGLAEAEFAGFPNDTWRQGLDLGLTSLARAVVLRDQLPALLDQGFKAYAPAQSLSVHALRAGGKAKISIDPVESVHPSPPGTADPIVVVGETIRLSAQDERGRPLSPPEIDNTLLAPILVRPAALRNEAEDKAEPVRQVIFTLPGEYLLRVPGRASGDQRLIAR